MRAYGKNRHWPCCPGHDEDWKNGVRKNTSRKSALRVLKKRARQNAKKTTKE